LNQGKSHFPKTFGNVTHYEYDAVGNQTAVIDALNHRTDNIYDEAGHLIVTANWGCKNNRVSGQR
jgi:YD repeat-containing protein